MSEIRPVNNLTTTEIVRHVDNNPNATAIERELVKRLMNMHNEASVAKDASAAQMQFNFEDDLK
jgi:hypothetical protein